MYMNISFSLFSTDKLSFYVHTFSYGFQQNHLDALELPNVINSFPNKLRIYF